jgi:hypothetical protein
MKKFIMAYALLLFVNAQSQEIALEACIERITQELIRIKDEAAQQHDECIKHKAVLLSDQGHEYQVARQNWFRNCLNNDGSSACKQAAQMLQGALIHLQKTDVYAQNYLPALEGCYLNAQKYYALAHMLSVVQQPEQLNPSIDSVQDRMLYAIDEMKVDGDPKPSQLWLELTHDRGVLNKRAQGELRDFVASVGN